MRIAWCSPLSRRSGVSKFSLAVVQALSELAEVDYWCESMDDNYAIDFAPVRELLANEACARQLEGYDVVVYNMGNNVDFHYVIHWLYTRVKGVVVLHDKYMHHFFAGHYLGKLESLTAYALAFRHYYGEKAKNHALRSIRRQLPVWETEEVATYPFFEPCLWNASGVVVHSRDALERISGKLGLVPASLLHHPFYITNYEYGDTPLLSRSDLGLDENKVIVLSHGFLNPNKRIDKVIEVIAGNPDLKRRVFYVVAGGCVLQRTFDHLQDVARQWGMLENIRFTGFIDDHTLHSYIAQADICLNLRYPSIESSSGSLVEQLYFGKPVVVTRIGAYDELPDEAVIKIDMGDEEGNLSRALEKLVDDQSHRRQVAAAGHAWALAHCSSHDYARQFVEFLSSIQKDGDTLDFVDGVADTLALFLHPGLRDDYARSIAREIQPFIG